MSLIGLIIIGFIITLFIFLFAALLKILQSKLLSTTTKTVIAIILIMVIVSPIFIIIPLHRTPTAIPINDVINITDESQQFSIVAIKMPAPTYHNGEGIIEKTYTSMVTVNVVNNSDQQVCLGLEYYANSGSIGPYSPGSTFTSKVVAIDANWAGDLQFPIIHHRFVKGGYIKLSLAKFKGPYSHTLVIPPGSIFLFEKKYYMVSEK